MEMWPGLAATSSHQGPHSWPHKQEKYSARNTSAAPTAISAWLIDSPVGGSLGKTASGHQRRQEPNQCKKKDKMLGGKPNSVRVG